MHTLVKALASLGLALAAFLHVPLTHAVVAPLPRLETRGNVLYRADTGAPVILRGAVSDYFRGGNDLARTEGLSSELQKVGEVGAHGGNVMGLYLSDSDRVKAHLDDLDAYIAYAEAHRMYVYLMPVARDFEGKQVPFDHAVPNTYAQLKDLLDLLSKRYAGKENVLFGFGAEPEGETDASWNDKQVELARIVRANDPDALLLVTGTMYYTGLDQYLAQPFPFDDVLYAGGGYYADSIAYAETHPETAAHVAGVRMAAFAAVRPYLAAEFGGYSIRDFSTESDRSILARMLDGMDAAGTSYTMYKLSGGQDDGFAIFQPSGTPTAKGKIFLDALDAYPPTRF